MRNNIKITALLRYTHITLYGASIENDVAAQKGTVIPLNILRAHFISSEWIHIQIYNKRCQLIVERYICMSPAKRVDQYKGIITWRFSLHECQTTNLRPTIVKTIEIQPVSFLVTLFNLFVCWCEFFSQSLRLCMVIRLFGLATKQNYQISNCFLRIAMRCNVHWYGLMESK